MRRLATQILLLIGVTVNGLTTADSDDVEGFFVSSRQRRLKETLKYVLVIFNFIF